MLMEPDSSFTHVAKSKPEYANMLSSGGNPYGIADTINKSELLYSEPQRYKSIGYGLTRSETPSKWVSVNK